MQLDAITAQALRNATVSGCHLTLVDQLARPDYIRVNKAIEMMGGKWNRKARCHVFDAPAEEVVADALSTGAVIDLRKLFQFFETPSQVAKMMVEMALVGPGMHVLEPSAGGGRIVREIESTGASVSICELHDARREALAKEGHEVLGSDFLAVAPDPRFDAVIANPPFAGGADVRHVRHMLSFLRPGGRLVSIMSPAWTFRTAKLHADFRNMVQDRWATWQLLPAGTFRAEGTDVSVGILAVRG